jgi:hypothetical protein
MDRTARGSYWRTVTRGRFRAQFLKSARGVKRLAILMAAGSDLRDIRTILHVMSHWVYLSPVTRRYAAQTTSSLHSSQHKVALCTLLRSQSRGRIIGRSTRTFERISKTSTQDGPAGDPDSWVFDNRSESRKQEITTSATGHLLPIHPTRRQAKHWSWTIILRPQGLPDTRPSLPVSFGRSFRDAAAITFIHFGK